MKILYIANRAEVFSGGQISLLELVSRIDRSKFEPVVLSPGEGGLPEKMREMGVKVYTWDMPTAKTLNIPRIRKKTAELRAIIDENGADIVHTNGSRAQLYASLALKGSKASLVWHVRESKKDIFLYDLFLARSAKRIICVSKAVEEKRFGRYPEIKEKLKVIYNGVDVHRFNKDEVARENIRKDLKIKGDSPLLGMLGLLVPLKGHIDMLKAFQMIKKKHLKAKLLIAGKTVDENYTEKLKKLTKDLRLVNDVVFTGPRDDVNSVLSALDIFVLPSEREGFSRALLEAMACAVPIIATDVGGNAEAIIEGETGLFVKYGNLGALANAAAYIINDPARASRMALSARKRAVDVFSIERHIDEVEKLYGEMKDNG